MSLVLNEDERMLARSVGALLDRAAPIAALRAMRNSGDLTRVNLQLWSQLADAGFVAPQLPETEGGLGMGYAAAGVVAEGLGRTLAATPFLSCAVAIELLLAAGDAAQRARFLPGLQSGEVLLALAHEEAGRHEPDAVSLRASRDGDGWTLQGEKRFVIDGGAANAFAVTASGEDGALRLFIIDKGAPGVAVTPLDLIDSRNAAEVRFSDVKAPASAVLAAGDPRAALDRALDVGRALLSAELLGLAQEAFDRTVAYLKEREQFGVKIGSFQALQHRAARLHVALEMGRGVVLKALRALDAGAADASLLASLAKGVLSKTAREVMTDALQMHGGIGLTDDFDIGLFVKRARVAGETFGDDYFHKERLARLAWRI